ncbi:family 78 glycoside hydrolase catalytic domain [Lactobacillus sp. ESL0731]|uniref:family 78 glycoside hydrolase catalytic domain n=1 Tax=unclassified Lactobacillus TaxID=2620435 RepID=UPI0023F9C2E8|nr:MULTISPECIES: family 78 glycoside hydrolase catalytic domain [unclassified Lactobacillus]WEV51084.1 family 78 glycoside hydrolase catalytic domain [Lactobacillus sp. ESL0700]WEV62213.1 family 78 glycoside hydrolase catalytic domain [Lactobacillus sp. ESL0731]
MGNELKVENLKVNLKSFSYSVRQLPTFSWQIKNENGCFQKEFRIIIAKSKDLLLKNKLLFDSKWVNSNNNTAVCIKEISDLLDTGTLYYWSVCIKDQNGNESEFSKPSCFITEFSQEKFDQLKGIWSLNKTGKEQLPDLGTTVFFRSPQFKVITENVDKAILTAVIKGNEPTLSQSCDLFFNGQSIGVGSARSHPNYHETKKTQIFYNSYDVTELIKENNLIAVKATGVDKKRAFYAFLTVYLENGLQQQVIVTSSDWKALDATAAYGDFDSKIRSLYFEMPEENVDMRYYPQGWMKNSYDDHNWNQALVKKYSLIGDDEFVSAYPSENTYRYKLSTKLQTIKVIAENDILIDLGKEVIGSLAVNINSTCDQETIIYSGEQLNDDGTVRHHLACGPDYVEKWTLVQGKNIFSTLQMKNFRYVELKGFVGEIHIGDITGWAMRQPFDDNEGSFYSDDKLLNAEYEMSKYTIEATNQDIYVDSQARERRPYEGDLLVNANTSYSISSNYSLARHSIDWLLDNPTWPEDYKLFNVEMAWYDYLYTGDISLLKTRYGILKKKFLRGPNDSDNFDEKVGLVSGNGLVDWPIRERDGFIESKYNTPFNSVYVGDYQIMAKIANELHCEQDSKFYLKRAAIIKNTLLTKLFNKQEGIFYDSMDEDGNVNKHCSHHASAYALSYQVFKDQAMADKLCTFVANNGEFVGSIYFIYFILKGLINGHHAELALKLLTNTNCGKDKKTFAAILNNLHATIAPEAWSNYYKPNLTMSHPWGASPGLVIIQGILGIEPIKPGFKEYSVDFHVGDLHEISAKVPTIQGELVFDYKLTDKYKVLKIKAPNNTIGKINLAFKSPIKEISGKACNKDNYLLIYPGASTIKFDK